MTEWIFGRNVDDVVMTQHGTLVAATTLTLYATEADALAERSAIASVPVLHGMWEARASQPQAWASVPGARPWEVIAASFIGLLPGLVDSAQTAASQATSSAADLRDLKPKVEQSIADAATAKSDAAVAVDKVTKAVTSQDSATAQNVQSGPLTKAALDGTYARVEGRPISAYDNGVRPDVPDVRQALNALVADNPGAQIVLAPGPYTASADNGGVTSYDRGIKLNRPNTTLDLRGATMTVLPNGAGNYQLITATAPDCRIIGGVLVGDVTTHKATDGEWGHGIVATTGGDRLLVDGTYITQMWGDGVFMDGGAADVCLRSVIADGNRRQGCSITNNVRPRIEGGAYINTGIHGFIAPGAGIDVEPDPNMGHSVTDFVIIEPLLAGNVGSGLMVCEAPGATTTGSAIVRSSGNQGHGVITDRIGPGELYSVTIQADCARNGGSGFVNNVPGTRLKGCIATGNAGRGFVINSRSTLLSPLAEENGMSGYYFDQGASGSFVMSIASNSNGRAQNDTYPDVDIWAPNVTITTGTSVAAETGNKASFGWVVRPSAANANLVGCSTSGTFPQGAYLDLGPSTRAVPTPGA